MKIRKSMDIFHRTMLRTSWKTLMLYDSHSLIIFDSLTKIFTPIKYLFRILVSILYISLLTNLWVFIQLLQCCCHHFVDLVLFDIFRELGKFFIRWACSAANLTNILINMPLRHLDVIYSRILVLQTVKLIVIWFWNYKKVLLLSLLKVYFFSLSMMLFHAMFLPVCLIFLHKPIISLHSNYLGKTFGPVKGSSYKMPLKREKCLIKWDLLIWLTFKIKISLLGINTTSVQISCLCPLSKPIVHKVSDGTSKWLPLSLVCSGYNFQWDFWSNINTGYEL